MVDTVYMLDRIDARLVLLEKILTSEKSDFKSSENDLNL
jgi:hypothetical protein